MHCREKKVRTLGSQKWRLCAIVLVIGLLWPYNVNADPSGPSIDGEEIVVITGRSVVVKPPWPTVRVAVTDPTIADVQVLTPDQVLLQGLKVGSTDLILWSENEQQIWQRRVLVILDTEPIRQTIEELFPTASLEVSHSREVLIVRGLFRSVDEASQLRQYLEKVGVTYADMTSVAGVQQVQLQVRVAEVSRRALRALGINAFDTDDAYFFGLRTGSSTGGALVPSIDIGPPAGPLGSGFGFPQGVTAGPLVTIFGGFPEADLEIFLRALGENQYMRILANPTLVALSGEQADFLAGGEFPIPVVQGGGGAGAGTSVTIEYKQYGIRLLFRPVVLGDGGIRLLASQEVSELTEVGAVVVQGFEVPALVTRKVETTLELKSGQTFAMAGLLQRTNGALVARIPGLGTLPVLGPLFRSVRYTENETELVILVTASLVEPISAATPPPTPGFLHTVPNDWELYIEGRLEGKEPARIDPASAQWLKEMGLGGLVGPGAWDSYDRPILPSPDGTAPEPTAAPTPMKRKEAVPETSGSYKGELPWWWYHPQDLPAI
ncbi:MAG: pilus assembly protein N-terminal domain-containing protein [Phycisphaerales bacterium]|nr:MAG: pilus assembly protein N-terminal domain-containing protein [Phycisphaerales bacterium]